MVSRVKRGIKLPQKFYDTIKYNLKVKINQFDLIGEYSLGSLPSVNRVYKVPVSEINHLIWRDELEKHFNGKIPVGPVWDGDWDILKTKFEKSYIHQSFVDRFISERSWEKTEYYDQLARKENKTHEKIIERLERYDEIFHDMKCSGYDHDYPIQVYIDREGEYIRRNGAHRLSMAKIAGVESIPVKNYAVHKKWQDLREEIYTSGLPEEREKKLENHPDLGDILD